MSVDVGESAKLNLEVRNEAGELADATEVVLAITDPEGTVTTKKLSEASVVKEATGKYYAVVTIDSGGRWKYTWTTTGIAIVENGRIETGVPTVDDVREWSKVDFDELEFEEPEGSNIDPLERIVLRSALWLQFTTGREFGEFEGESLEEDHLLAGMQQAVKMLVEYEAYLAQPEHAETASDFNEIQSFSAGNYSETRRSPNSRTRGLHPWHALDELLYDLLTDERKAALGGDGPAIKTDSSPYWNVGQDIMGYNEYILTPFGRFRPPWDQIIEEVI